MAGFSSLLKRCHHKISPQDMPSHALKSFVRAFNSPKAPLQAIYLPRFLVPAATEVLPRITSHPGVHRREWQRNASTDRYSGEHIREDSNFGNVENEASLRVEAIVSSLSRKDPKTWAGLVEAYLPLHLREGGQDVVKIHTQVTNLHSIYTLPLLLSKARSYAGVDLLSYLGVYQGRWEAVMWLIKALMDHYPRLLKEEQEARQIPSLIWPMSGQSLDMITDKAIETELSSSSKQSLESLTLNGIFDPQGPPLNLGREILGQIWQSLGTMVLQAADRSPEDPSYSTIMSHVFQILAHLHHIEAFPSSIYNYTPASDPTVMQRPPTLHLLSRRIMSTLSDLEWGLQWQDEISKYQKLGYDLAKAPVLAKIREFGPETWLDLILWACVEGSWIEEGVWLVTEMERRKANKNTQWSVINWQDICAFKESELDLTAIMKSQIERTRLNQVGAIGIATGPNSTVNMGERTVSREVVLAILDGLLNTRTVRTNARGLVFSDTQRKIMACKDLLERHHPQLDHNFLNANILRILEGSGADLTDKPGILKLLLDLRGSRFKGRFDDDSTSNSVQDLNTDDSAAFLGLLHRNLNNFAQENNVQGSLITLRQIQDLIDHLRNENLKAFAVELKESMLQARYDTRFLNSNESKLWVAHPQIPIAALVSLLDLITDTEIFDVGKWLLFNDDIDGGLFDPELYSDSNLQPALLRFATATADNQLLTKVLERLETPLSEQVLHAVLRCQVALRNWNAIDDLLSHLQRTPNMSWSSSDATSIAGAIIQLEHGPQGSTSRQSMDKAIKILHNILDGRYNTIHQPSELPDFLQSRLANQLRRMIRTLPGILSNVNETFIGDPARAHSRVEIPAISFNILLQKLVQYCGPMDGRRLWERWCHDPGEALQSIPVHESLLNSDGGKDRESVVTPSVYMLRIIMQPIVDSRRASRKKVIETAEVDGDMGDVVSKSSVIHARSAAEEPKDQFMVAWGLDMFRKFGLSEKAIMKEIPGALSLSRHDST